VLIAAGRRRSGSRCRGRRRLAATTLEVHGASSGQETYEHSVAGRVGFNKHLRRYLNGGQKLYVEKKWRPISFGKFDLCRIREVRLLMATQCCGLRLSSNGLRGLKGR
jgi:hypothetical protein